MLYKDITQWLRNRTFVALFFGLLLIAEGISVFVMSLGDELPQPGPAVFYSLYTILIIYALIIAFMGHSLTAREFANRTFELYELSGMSLERMIGGKLLSMVYEFLFGFFCIVPFMFFAYFLGGLDFFDLISGAVITLISFLPIYLLTLLFALSTRLKQVMLLGRIATVFALIFIVMTGFVSLFSPSSPISSLFRATSNLIKGLIGGDWRALLQVIVFLFFYAQTCLLLFYLCCNTISRDADSRELPVKLLLFTQVSSWLLYRTFMVWRWGYSVTEPGFTCIPVFLVLCVMGVTLFYNRHAVPVIIRRKYEKASAWKKTMYYIFQPGTAGTVRTLMLVFLVLIGCAAGIYNGATAAGVVSGHDPRDEWLQAVSIPLQVPFFLIFPFGFMINLRGVRQNYVLQRTLVLMWWGVAGAIAASLVAWWNWHSSPVAGFFEFAALLISPFSSAFADVRSQNGVYDAAPYVRLITGVIGMVLMQRYLARIRSLQKQGLLPDRPVSTDPNTTSASLAA